MIEFLNKMADNYYKHILKKKIESELSIYNLDIKFEIKNNNFKVFIKKRKYNDKMFSCILYLETYDILYYICNFDSLKRELIRKIDTYFEGRVL